MKTSTCAFAAVALCSAVFATGCATSHSIPAYGGFQLRTHDEQSGALLPGFRTVSNVTERFVTRSVPATGRRVGYDVLMWEVSYRDEYGKVVKATPAEADSLFALRAVAHKPGSGVLQTVIPSVGFVTTDLTSCKWGTNGDLLAISLMKSPLAALTTAYVVDRGKFIKMSYGSAQNAIRVEVRDLSPLVQSLAGRATHVSSDMTFLDATGKELAIGEPLFLEYAALFDCTLTFSNDGADPISMSGRAFAEAVRAATR